ARHCDIVVGFWGGVPERARRGDVVWYPVCGDRLWRRRRHPGAHRRCRAAARPGSLAAAWDGLISLGPDARRSFGAKARDRVIASYALPAIIARYDALYSGFLAQHRNEHYAKGHARGAGLGVGWTRQRGP